MRGYSSPGEKKNISNSTNNIYNLNNIQTNQNKIYSKNNGKSALENINTKNECRTNHADPIPENIGKKIYNSIVNIKLLNSNKEDINATGFFMIIKINNKEEKCLLTCKHVISNDDINNKIIINLYYGEKDKEEERKIVLDETKRYIKVFNEDIDVTLIEIVKDDNIPENKYLIADLNYEYGYNRYDNNNFYLAGYPKNFDERCLSSGKITKINDFIFEHQLDTREGSSGSPICNKNGDVIGIHTSGNKEEEINYGIFIGKIMDTLKNELPMNGKSNIINIIVGEIYISDNDINKEIRIINSYEQWEREHPNNKVILKNKNEKEIKENCEIKINSTLIPFSYIYKFRVSGLYKIEYSFKKDLSNINFLFSECSNLTNLNLSNFNTKNVIDMEGMFQLCSKLTNLNLSNFNTENVTNMIEEFRKIK